MPRRDEVGAERGSRAPPAPIAVRPAPGGLAAAGARRRGRAGSSRAGSSSARRAGAAATGRRRSTACGSGVMADLHAGVPHVGRDAIAPRGRRAQRARARPHLLLGDYLDASQILGGRLAPEAVAAELARLRAPLGTVAVIGNHDWRNSRRPHVAGARAPPGSPCSRTGAAAGPPAGGSGSPGWPTSATAAPDIARGAARRPARRAGARALARPRPVPAASRRGSRSRSPATCTAARWRSRCCAARRIPSAVRRALRARPRRGGRPPPLRDLRAGHERAAVRLLAPPEVVLLELRPA